MNRIAEINQKRMEIRAKLTGKEDFTNEELNAFEAELRQLDEEQVRIEKRAEIANGINVGTIDAAPVAKPVEQREDAKGIDSKEYRQAFMDYVTKGIAIPKELRANTMTSDVGAVVPPTTLNKIVEKLEAYGMILPLVTKTAYKSGLAIPTSAVKPVATWVAEGAGSPLQNKTVGTITFSHFKLRCAVSVSLETEHMTLSAFESTLVNNIGEAMAKAVEQAIISGDGTASPTGILKDLTDVETVVTTAISYKDIVAMESALPMEYENGAVWVMSKKTFGEFIGMEDKNGQPIARVNYGIAGAPERTILGRRVVLTNYLPAFDAKKGDVAAFIYDFSDYVLNTNFQVGMKVYENDETDDIVRKSILVCDGKPVLKESLVVLTGKGAGA